MTIFCFLAENSLHNLFERERPVAAKLSPWIQVQGAGGDFEDDSCKSSKRKSICSGVGKTIEVDFGDECSRYCMIDIKQL